MHYYDKRTKTYVTLCCILTQYDETIISAGIDRGPIIAKILNEYFLSSEGRSNARVLDLAAGTGLVGETLNKVGFTNIDAIGR